MTKLAAAAGVALTGLVALLALAVPAGAHAELESTEPAAGAALEEPPTEVVLHFNEPVEAALGAIRVYDADGERVDTGGARRPADDSDAVAVDLDTSGNGGYVVTWRVVSADAHPINGAFTFRVGDAAAGATDDLIRRLLAAEGGSPTVGAAYGVARVLVFASLILLVGGTFFVLWVWPEGRSRRWPRRLIWAAWAALVVASAIAVPLQGAFAGGLPLGDVLRPAVVESVLETRFGTVTVARLLILAVAAAVLVALLRRRQPEQPVSKPVLVVGAVVALGLLATPGLAGHAGTGDLVWAAVVADVIHLTGVSAWLGGLAALTLFVLPGDEDSATSAVPRFSQVALVSVIAIAASGLFQGWRQVGSIDALTQTTYGRLLTVKVVLFAVMIALGNLGRRWVQRRYRSRAPALSLGPGAMATDATGDADEPGGDRPPALGELRRSVAAETLIGIAVLAVAALLVNAQPARSALAQPYSTEIEAGEVLVSVTIDPAKAGTTEVHIYTTDRQGLPADVADLTAELRLPERDVGPLEIPLERVAPGHFASYSFDLPLPGEWELTTDVLLSDVEQVSGTATIPVR